MGDFAFNDLTRPDVYPQHANAACEGCNGGFVPDDRCYANGGAIWHSGCWPSIAGGLESLMKHLGRWRPPPDPRDAVDYGVDPESLLRGLLEREDLSRGVKADVEVALAGVERLRRDRKLERVTGAIPPCAVERERGTKDAA